jgi:UV DNA damage repair endonuclease
MPTQHGSNTTWQQHNMEAAQHGSSTKQGTHIIGHRQQHKGQKVETTIHHAKQPQLSVRVSMIECLNEEMEIKLYSLSVFLQIVPVVSFE